MGVKRDHLVNFSTAGRVITFILLGWVTFYYQQLIQIFFLYKKWLEAWCVVFTVTKHWGGYCSFGASVLKFIFQHKKMKLWNKWSFVQNKTDYLIIHHTFIIQYINLSKYIKWISRSIFLKGFTHANISLCHNGSLVSRVWTASNYSKDYWILKFSRKILHL